MIHVLAPLAGGALLGLGIFAGAFALWLRCGWAPGQDPIYPW